MTAILDAPASEPKIVVLVRLLNAIDEGNHSFESLKDRVAEGGRRPSTRSLRRYLSILAEAGFPLHFDRASNAWSLIASLTAPLYEGGTLRAERRAAGRVRHRLAPNRRISICSRRARRTEVSIHRHLPRSRDTRTARVHDAQRPLRRRVGWNAR